MKEYKIQERGGTINAIKSCAARVLLACRFLFRFNTNHLDESMRLKRTILFLCSFLKFTSANIEFLPIKRIYRVESSRAGNEWMNGIKKIRRWVHNHYNKKWMKMRAFISASLSLFLLWLPLCWIVMMVFGDRRRERESTGVIDKIVITCYSAAPLPIHLVSHY